MLEVQVTQGRLDEAQRDEVLAAIDALPGVASVAYLNALPLSGRPGVLRFARAHAPDDSGIDGALYRGSKGFLNVLGVRIIAGRGFVDEDFQASSGDSLAQASSVILTETFSRRLSAPLGSQIRIGSQHLMVIGITEDVLQPTLVSPVVANYSAFIPSPPGGVFSYQIVVNVEPSALPARLRDTVATATRMTPRTLLWSAKPFSRIRQDYFKLDRAVIRLVLVLGAVPALAVAGGVGGLSSYWIIRRHKQIAIRRALGARRLDIAWYFHLENLMVTCLGVLIGFAGAIALSVMLTKWLPLPSMSIGPLAWAAVAMIVIGQLAVLAPVRRAVRVSPAGLKAA